MAESPGISRLSAIKQPYQICQFHANCSDWVGSFSSVKALQCNSFIDIWALENQHPVPESLFFQKRQIVFFLRVQCL